MSNRCPSRRIARLRWLVFGGTVTLATALFPALGGAAAASSAPLVVSIALPLNTPLANGSAVVAGVKGAARAINKSGGIQGHKVSVRICNTMINPNQEVACATDAEAAGALAMVGSIIILNPQGYENALASGSTADLAANAVSPPQFNDQVAFPLGFYIGAQTVCATRAFEKLTGEKTRLTPVLDTIPESEVFGTALKNAGASTKVAVTPEVPVPLSTVDFSPIVGQAAAQHPNVVAVVVAQSQFGPFLTTSIGAGQSWTTCSVDGSLTDAQLTSIGSAASKYYQGAYLPPLSAARQFPELKKFISQMRAEQAAGDSAANIGPANYLSETLNAWLGMQVVDQVASSIKGPITHSTFLAALKRSKVDLGVLPPINFGHPIGSGQYPNVFSAKEYLEHWNVSKHEEVLVPSVTVQNGFALSGLG